MREPYPFPRAPHLPLDWWIHLSNCKVRVRLSVWNTITTVLLKLNSPARSRIQGPAPLQAAVIAATVETFDDCVEGGEMVTMFKGVGKGILGRRLGTLIVRVE